MSNPWKNRGWRLTGLGFALVLAAAAPANASGTPRRAVTAEQFVRMLYANEGKPGWEWEPRYLSARTRALYSKLGALAATTSDGGVHTLGGMDYDMLCGCQDPGGYRIYSLSIAAGARGQTVAVVRFGFGPSAAPKASSTVRLILVKESGWKIDDLVDQYGGYVSRIMAHIQKHGR